MNISAMRRRGQRKRLENPSKESPPPRRRTPSIGRSRSRPSQKAKPPEPPSSTTSIASTPCRVSILILHGALLAGMGICVPSPESKTGARASCPFWPASCRPAEARPIQNPANNRIPRSLERFLLNLSHRSARTVVAMGRWPMRGCPFDSPPQPAPWLADTSKSSGDFERRLNLSMDATFLGFCQLSDPALRHWIAFHTAIVPSPL